MRIEQLDYDLPPELIAQHPVHPRDQARLLVLERETETITHRRVRDLPSLLSPQDCLVLNDTRVVPGRLLGRRASTGGRWEGLFIRTHGAGLWEFMCQTRGALRVGERIVLDGAGESALILRERTPNGHWFAHPLPDQSLEAVLERHGQVPLPPYIRRSRSEPGDRDDYQTVFARRPGAVAAPTAGLHFTPELLGRLQHKGVELVWLTLHVGPGTFQPIRESLESHVMHSEWGELGPEAARRIERRRRLGGRTVAVGTTSVRLLETVAPHGLVQAWSGETALFIHSPYTFRVVDAMMTNFHLPRSTLLALVYAFAGEEFGRRAYAAAVQQRYRFYSFGDAMLIL